MAIIIKKGELEKVNKDISKKAEKALNKVFLSIE